MIPADPIIACTSRKKSYKKTKNVKSKHGRRVLYPIKEVWMSLLNYKYFWIITLPYSLKHNKSPLFFYEKAKRIASHSLYIPWPVGHLAVRGQEAWRYSYGRTRAKCQIRSGSHLYSAQIACYRAGWKSHIIWIWRKITIPFYSDEFRAMGHTIWTVVVAAQLDNAKMSLSKLLHCC